MLMVENRVEHYRHRAEKLRTLAQEMKDEGAKEAILKNAEDYEQMARNAEQLPTDWRP
jgi:hypothetical protein